MLNITARRALATAIANTNANTIAANADSSDDVVDVMGSWEDGFTGS